MKQCKKCKKTKSVEDFCLRKRSSDGRQPWCRICSTKIFKSYYKDNPEAYRVRAKKVLDETFELVKSLKDNQPCTDCGVRYPYYVMDYDHLDSSIKEDNIGNLIKSGKKKVLDEIKKCELVCSNCHRQRTYNRNSGS